MDLPLDAIEPFAPTWGQLEEWNSAYEKLEDYLRAYGVDSRLHRARLNTAILRRVSGRWAGQPCPAPVATLAIEEANRMLSEWFARLLQAPAGTESGFASAEGRVAFLLCDGAARWPYSFLEGDPIPETLRAAMRNSSVRAGPELQISSMVPRPLDYGLISEFAGDTLGALNRRPLIKALAAALFFLALLAYLFWITR